MARNKKGNKSKFIFPKNGFTIDHRVLNHPDYIILSNSAKSLLFDMFPFYNGFNNGDLSIAPDDMEIKGWSKTTLHRAKEELIKFDWIRLTGLGQRKFRPCHLYAFSWVPLDECKGKLEITIKDFVLRDLTKTM